MSDTDTRTTLADLEARVLDGDDTVTVEQLAQARAADQLADLRAQAATRATASVARLDDYRHLYG